MRKEEQAMSKLELIYKLAEENVKTAESVEHTDTTHTDYDDSCGIIF